jgi:hypothetical protein
MRFNNVTVDGLDIFYREDGYRLGRRPADRRAVGYLPASGRRRRAAAAQ